jgi:hypothetical protein
MQKKKAVKKGKNWAPPGFEPAISGQKVHSATAWTNSLAKTVSQENIYIAIFITKVEISTSGL